MTIAALVFAGLAALLHVYIFVMESFTWTTPRTRAVFGTSPEEAETTKLLAYNQGFYNLFLAIVTAIGIVALAQGHNGIGAALVFAGAGSMLAAAVVALGALGALVLALVNRRLSRTALEQTMQTTLRLTSMVMMLLVGSAAFTLVFRGLNGDLWIEHHLTSLPGGVVGFLLVANLVIFVLGFFIDFFEIAFIILPLLVPAARILGIDLVWFGVMIGINLQTSFLTPPFGFALFYLRGVAPPELKTSEIYRGVLPFIALQLLMLGLLVLFPGLVSH